MTHHPSAASLRLHGARLLFPPAATLLFLLLTEYIARGALSGRYLCAVHLPHPEAYLLAWGLLFLVWMAVDWLTRFAPLATLLSALLGCLPATVDFYILQLRGEPLPPVGFDAGVRGGRRGLCGGHPRPEEHGRLRRRGAGSDRRLLLPLPGPSEAALGAASGGLRGQHSGRLRPHLRGVLQPAVTQSLGILPDAWMQDRYYRYYGVITSFLTNLTNLEIDKPEDYSEEAVNAILDDVEAGEKYTTGPVWPGSYAARTPADEQVKQPTILYVMDESYWDVSELEQYGFQFDTDVSANLHALQQTSAYGRVYSPSFGGGTCDVEFEALTGYSVSLSAQRQQALPAARDEAHVRPAQLPQDPGLSDGGGPLLLGQILEPRHGLPQPRPRRLHQPREDAGRPEGAPPLLDHRPRHRRLHGRPDHRPVRDHEGPVRRPRLPPRRHHAEPYQL